MAQADLDLAICVSACFYLTPLNPPLPLLLCLYFCYRTWEDSKSK